MIDMRKAQEAASAEGCLRILVVDTLAGMHQECVSWLSRCDGSGRMECRHRRPDGNEFVLDDDPEGGRIPGACGLPIEKRPFRAGCFR